MDALKRKAKETLEDIKRAENRHKDLIRYLGHAEGRAEMAEDEVRGLQDKISEKKKELESVSAAVKEKELGHSAKEEEAEESEKIRKALEAKGFEVDDQLVMLEIKVRDAKRQADEKEAKLEEAKVRCSTIQAELSELLARLNTAESKIVKLSEESDCDLVKLIKLERRHRKYDQRQEQFEDEIETREQQITNLEIECATYQAGAKILVSQRDKLKSECLKKIPGNCIEVITWWGKDMNFIPSCKILFLTPKSKILIVKPLCNFF